MGSLNLRGGPQTHTDLGTGGSGSPTPYDNGNSIGIVVMQSKMVMIQFSYTAMCCTGKRMIATCVVDVLPTCTVAGKSRPLLLLHYDLSAQMIIVNSHFHFTQHSYFRLGPPNFGLLAQKGLSQQPSTPLHFDISPISSKNCLQCMHVPFPISCKTCWFHWLLYISC